MNQGQKQTVEWFVIFTKTKVPHWVFKWLHPEFQHVYAMKKSEGEQFWMIVNPLRCHTQVDMVLVDHFPHPRVYAGDGAIIIPIKAEININKDRWTLCIFNCVEVIKSLLGIKDFWLWTPYQLYKRLKGD